MRNLEWILLLVRLHNLTPESPLPNRDVIMNHKKQLIKVLWSIDHGFPQLALIGKEQCLFKHDETDVNIIRYLLLLQDNKSHIQITAEDTDIFVLLLFHT